ncbi:hypothetical protein EWH99_09735 [Sporolactobacillus sp. THM7-7]|nr:hypothetical protein EWH99_09735 [Sporolactobacillus sp. THM7-7]
MAEERKKEPKVIHVDKLVIKADEVILKPEREHRPPFSDPEPEFDGPVPRDFWGFPLPRRPEAPKKDEDDGKKED